MKKKSSKILFRIIFSLIILILLTIIIAIRYFSVEKKNSIYILQQLNTLSTNQEINIDSIKEFDEFLSKKYSKFYARFVFGQDILKNQVAIISNQINLEYNKKLPNLELIRSLYNLLKKYYNDIYGVSTVEDKISYRAKLIYDEILYLVHSKDDRMVEANSLYTIIKKYYFDTIYHEKAESLIKNEKKIKEEDALEIKRKEAKEQAEVFAEKQKRERNTISIGDSERDIRYLKGYYKKTTSEYGSHKTNHYFGNEGTKYKYITATDGYVDYFSY